VFDLTVRLLGRQEDAPGAGNGTPYATRADVPLTYFDAMQIDWVQILSH
jgi:hypothetical protein